MKRRGPTLRMRRSGVTMLAGAAASLTVAVALFTRFDLKGGITRDEAIYTYAGQQMARGVPVYLGIFDPKGPLPTWIAGWAAMFADAIGRNDIYMIRAAFFVTTCLTVVAVYLLAARMWRSPLVGLVAAVVMACYPGFAQDALAGPNAKTPGILFALLSMWLVLERRWFWAAAAGSVAFLAWQPLLIYPTAAAVIAVLAVPARQRPRVLGLAVAGGAAPLVLTTLYLAAVGALGAAVDTTILFPVRGVQRGAEAMSDRLDRIIDTILLWYGFSGWVLFFGIAVLVVAAIASVRGGDEGQPWRLHLIGMVMVTLGFQVAVALADFQGYPDVYPLLPYGALGAGGAAAFLVGRLRQGSAQRLMSGAVVVSMLVMTVVSWNGFNSHRANNDTLVRQRLQSCKMARMAGTDGGTLYVMGDPRPVALTRRQNTDRFIYLGSGVDRWKIDRTPGGFEGWLQEIRTNDPPVIAMATWTTPLQAQMAQSLQSLGYETRDIGRWTVFTSESAGSSQPPAGRDVATPAAPWRRCEPRTPRVGPTRTTPPPSPRAKQLQ